MLLVFLALESILGPTLSLGSNRAKKGVTRELPPCKLPQFKRKLCRDRWRREVKWDYIVYLLLLISHNG